MGGMAEPIRVLHVDDERAFGGLTAGLLAREDGRLEAVAVTSVRAGLDVLDAERIDCILSDCEMPRASGLAFFETVRERHEDVPFIVLTGLIDDGTAGEAAATGVTDYLRKTGDPDQYATLAERIAEAVAAHRAGTPAERWGR